jgi:hypothetical protein
LGLPVFAQYHFRGAERLFFSTMTTNESLKSFEPVERLQTKFRIGRIIKNKKTGMQANVTAVCNDHIVAVSYDCGAFRIYSDRVEDFQ